MKKMEMYLAVKGSIPSNHCSALLPLASYYFQTYELIETLILILRMRNRANIHLEVISQPEKGKVVQDISSVH